MGSGELESGGLGSENLGLGVWGRRSCGWGVGSEKLGSGNGVEKVEIWGLALRGLRSGGWSREDWGRRSCGWGVGSKVEEVGVGGVGVGGG